MSDFINDPNGWGDPLKLLLVLIIAALTVGALAGLLHWAAWS